MKNRISDMAGEKTFSEHMRLAAARVISLN